MDGTLLDLGFDNWFWQQHVPEVYARQHRLEPGTAAELLAPRFRAAQGSLAWSCIEHWSRELALDIGHLKRAAGGRVRFLPGAADFLGWLGVRGKRRILVTNAHPQTLAIKDERVSLGPLLDELHSSHSYGRPKEDPEFWPRLAASVRFDPRRTLFVDDSLPVLWAGYDHKARAQAIATWFVERRQVDGWPAHRLVPLLAGLLELVPWLCQWHNDIDPDMGIGMGDFYAGFVAEQARELELTEETIRAWTPPAATRRPRRKSAAA